MKTQFIILFAGLMFMGFLGCHEEVKQTTITNSTTMSDSLPNMDAQDLLDSLDGMDVVPNTHF